jgi:hypothetical protein
VTLIALGAVTVSLMFINRGLQLMPKPKPLRAGEALSREALNALGDHNLWPDLKLKKEGERRYAPGRHNRRIEAVRDSIHIARMQGVYGDGGAA